MTERTVVSRPSPKGSSAVGMFRHPDGVLPNCVAISYAFGGYILGLFLLAQTGIAFVAGIFLLAHSLVIAAYLIHECTHGSLFAQGKPGSMDRHNLLGVVLSWLTGASYSELNKIRDKHMRHHFDRADIVALDYRAILERNPRLKKAVETGQWLCLPAVEMLMHALVIVRPFQQGGHPQHRMRIIAVAVGRIIFFALLAQIGGWSLLAGYAVAYLIFLTVLGFMDTFQHQYLLLEGLEADRKDSPTRDRNRFPEGYFSRDYEDAHTFSNLFSERFPALNLLVLNFTYHNVHHQHPMEPWYRLPKLHGQGGGEIQVVPFCQQVRDFFRYRVERVMALATDDLIGEANVGAAGVSFLTAL